MPTKLLSFIILFLFSSNSFGVLRVVTTTEDLASLTKSIGGELVDVVSITKGTQDPHFIEAKPSFLVTLSRADLLIAVGLSLEHGWLPLLQRGARNPKVMPGNPGYLDCSQGIQPLEIMQGADRSQGDVHPEGNPHYMADPERGLKVAGSIAKRLSELDKENAAAYQANHSKFQGEFKAKIENWKKRLTKFKGTKLFGYHKSFNYFFNYFGFEPVGYLEPKSGIPPTAQHILTLTETTKNQKVKVIVMESYFETETGRVLSEKTGVPLLPIPAYTGGDARAKKYSDWMELLVTEFESHLAK